MPLAMVHGDDDKTQTRVGVLMRVGGKADGDRDF